MRDRNLGRGLVSITCPKRFTQQKPPAFSWAIALWWEGVCVAPIRRALHRQPLMDHEKLPSGERQYMCRICQEGFCRKGDLMKHEILHSGIKPYLCSSSLSALLEHSTWLNIKYFTLLRGLVCSNCQKSFTNQYPPGYPWNTAFLHQRLCVCHLSEKLLSSPGFMKNCILVRRSL